MGNEKSHVVFGEYAVGIIDVLNQREKLRHWMRPRDAEEFNRLVGVLKESYGPVSQFRETLTKTLREFANLTTGPIREELKPLHDRMTEEQKAMLAEMRTLDYGIMYYSDTIVVYSRLFSLNNVPQLSGLYMFLSALGGLMLGSLAGGVAIRGAIEVGLAGPLPEGDIYGPALVLAHDLEANIAQYPRLVIGQQAMAFIDFVQKHASAHYFEQVAKATAANCLKLIRPDPVDGWPIVDYLGAGFVELSEGGIDASAIAGAIEFAKGELQTAQRANDVKLAPRYERLTAYLQEGRKNWSQEVKWWRRFPHKPRSSAEENELE